MYKGPADRREREGRRVAATAGTSFLASLRFAGHILGLDGAVAAAESKRLQGLAFRLHATKRALQQKAPLTVPMVAALETLAAKASSVRTRIVAGYFVFLVLASGRFSDAMAVEALQLDVVEKETGPNGWLEAAVCRTKTATTLMRKTRFLAMALAMAAPVRGVTDLPWAQCWLRARREAGLKEARGVPLLPMYSAGAWMDRPRAAGEGGKMLRELLILSGFEEKVVSGVSTRSCKATALSVLVKRLFLRPSGSDDLG